MISYTVSAIHPKKGVASFNISVSQRASIDDAATIIFSMAKARLAKMSEGFDLSTLNVSMPDGPIVGKPSSANVGDINAALVKQ